MSGSGSEWKWRYSCLVGFMYGPVPVSLVAAGIGLIVYYLVQ